MGAMSGQGGSIKGAVWGQLGGKVEVTRGQCGRWKYQGGSVGALSGQGGSIKGAVWGQRGGKVEVTKGQCGGKVEVTRGQCGGNEGTSWK